MFYKKVGYKKQSWLRRGNGKRRLIKELESISELAWVGDVIVFFIKKLVIKELTTTGKRQDAVFINELEFISELVTSSSFYKNVDWILQAFQQGPNYASHNLEHLFKCPVFPEEEADVLTLRSHPDTSLKQQILQAEKGNDDEEFLLPRPEHVDDESWMDLEGNRSEDDLDSMLSKFQSFLVQPSGLESVESHSRAIHRRSN